MSQLKFSLELFDQEQDITIVIKNLELNTLGMLSQEDSIKEICSGKFYMYGVYDKMDLLGYKWMVLKQSKKNVVLLKI